MSAPEWTASYAPFARQLTERKWVVAFPLIGGRGRVAMADEWGIGDFY